MTEQTEEHLLTHLAILLSGKNAEKRILGTHTTGCAEDFARAKRVAQDMVEQFAMTAYGATADKILATAEEMSNTIISSRKEKLERIAHILLEEKELTGERFKVLFSGE
jgi:ATP-dependent Zn protease